MKALVVLFFLLLGSVTPDALAAQTTEPNEVLGSCTITFTGTIDGKAVDVTITVSDVNAIECAAMKVAARKAMK